MVTLISQKVIETAHHRVDSLEHNYIKYFEKLGCNLVPIPNATKNLDFYFSLPVKRIILTGGGDIDPGLYGGERSEGNYFQERDETEKALLDFAIQNKIPVLGICRGMQFINVYFGGRLTSIENHVAVNHKIEIVDEKLRKRVGREIEVNSFHGSGFSEKGLSSKLKFFAKSPDGFIEGIYHLSLPIAGIMWHPERKGQNEEANEKILRTFLNKDLFWKK